MEKSYFQSMLKCTTSLKVHKKPDIQMKMKLIPNLNIYRVAVQELSCKPMA